jgi:heptosyltransferase-2
MRRSARPEAAPPRPGLVVGRRNASPQSTATVGVARPAASVVFAPGAEYGPAKCWPASHYAELRALAAWAQRGPVLVARLGQGKALCSHGDRRCGARRCRVSGGRTTLDEAIALIARLARHGQQRLGLMHRRGAFGVPAGRGVRLDEPGTRRR